LLRRAVPTFPWRGVDGRLDAAGWRD